MTQRIRSNMGELKSYSEKTTEINIEIQKRVVVLSSMLQMSYLIAQGAKLEEVLKLATEKSRLLANSDIAYLFFRERGEETFCMKAADGVSAKQLLKISIDSKDELFNRVISANKPLIIDSQNILPRNLITVLQERFNLNNTFALPVYLRGEVIAILGIGNTREAFTYRKEDEELLDIFAKQIAIAVENDILVRRLEKLEIKDALTGLYNEAFIRSRLQEEIKRAIMYQRPCAFLVFDIDDFTKFREAFGSLQAEAILKKIAFLIKDSISEIDRSGRTADNEFSIILPEKNKRQAQAIAENIRKKIEYSFSEEKDPARKITISGGVSENPLDGVDAEQLLSKAKELLSFAKEQGKNRVVSFKEPPVC
jgi:diguanylate cyclase (GGDEF)-like protein